MFTNFGCVSANIPNSDTYQVSIINDGYVFVNIIQKYAYTS